MMEKIKAALKKIGIHKIKRAVLDIMEVKNLKGKSVEDIFTDIYENNSWNGKESISGEGSDLKETTVLLSKLPAFLKKYKVKRIIDVPCGDYNWMRHLDYKFGHYTGIDIVQSIVDQNNKKFGNSSVEFKKKNCLEDRIEQADLLFCRDLLIHFCEEDVFKFLRNIVKSDIEYLLTTHFIGLENTNILTGQWRPTNLCAEPYNLPTPLDYILEETKMFNGRYAKIKSMALWRIADIKEIIDKA